MRKDGDSWDGFPESLGSPHGYNWLCKSVFWTTVGASPGLPRKEQKLRIKLKSEGKDQRTSPKVAADSEFPTENSLGRIPPPSFHAHMSTTAGRPSCAQSGPKKDRTSKK
uniref:Uncharacterized protein n=1 Tax=Micrurus paraensis TaxID=1970185 RepID=A0A2D4KX40_9SAUR